MEHDAVVRLLILILLVFNVKCPSAGPRYIIVLMPMRDKRNANNTLLLKSDSFFTIARQPYHREYDQLTCRDKQNLNWIHVSLHFTKDATKNTLFKATATMRGIWKCTLYRANTEGGTFDLKVNIINDAYEPSEKGENEKTIPHYEADDSSNDYQKNKYTHIYMPIYINKTISIKKETNASQSPVFREIYEDIGKTYTVPNETALQSNINVNIDGKITLIITITALISAIIVLIGFLVGVRVGRKIWKNPGNRHVEIVDPSRPQSTDHVYEEIDK